MNKKFTIECTMEERWIPHFLGMLCQMQILGSQGSSRNVAIFSDGDGDFRPKFSWDGDQNLPNPAEPSREHRGGDTTFDAG